MVKTFDTQLTNVAYQYAKLTHCRVTKTTLQKDLEESPFYPSLLSLTKTFARYNVPSNAYKVGAPEFSRLQPPFLALLKIGGRDNDFVLVTAVTEKTIDYIYEKRVAEEATKEVFFKDFQGVVWVASPGGQSGEKDYERQVKMERSARFKKAGLIAGALFIYFALAFLNANTGGWLFFTLLLLLKSAGCFIACLLLLYEVDKNSKLVKSICATGKNKKTNCDAVLNSKASRIFGIGLGEIGFFYFASTDLLLLIPGLSIWQKLPWLAAANICAVPFLLFSLYYQWLVAKQWCKLCLATQAVLATELLYFLLFFWDRLYLPVASITDLCLIICCMVLPVISWYALKPAFIKAKGYSTYYNAFQRFKNAPGTFKMLLEKQNPIYPGWEHLGFVIGNPIGSIDVVMVSDPFCGPCAQAHSHLHSLLLQNKNVRLRIIFINENIESNRGALVAKHLMAIAYANLDMGGAQAAWYSNRSYPEIVKKYPVPDVDIARQAARLEAMHAWCIIAGIIYTPSIFVNGYVLPDDYSLEDLKHVLQA